MAKRRATAGLCLRVRRRLRCALPWRVATAPPCVPTGRQIRQFENGRILPHDRFKPHQAPIVFPRVLESQELPAVIVFVVGDVQNRSAAEDDGTQRDGRSVPRLVEGPLWFRHTWHYA